MSTHIGAEPGQIAPTVLLPGDPLRARWIAETFLDDATCYSEVRGHARLHRHLARRSRSRCRARAWDSRRCRSTSTSSSRSTTCSRSSASARAARSPRRWPLRDVVIASGACTDSSMNRLRFHGLDYAPVADFGLLRAAHDAAAGMRGRHHPRGADLLRRLVLLTAPGADRADGRPRRAGGGDGGLGALHARRVVRPQALAVCTVSDHIVTGEETTATEREQTFGAMVRSRSGLRCRTRRRSDELGLLRHVRPALHRRAAGHR